MRDGGGGKSNSRRQTPKMGTLQIWSFRDLPLLSGVSNPAFDSIFLLKDNTKSNMFKYQIESKIKEVQTMTAQSKSLIPILCFKALKKALTFSNELFHMQKMHTQV